MESLKASKLLTPVKACAFIALATIGANAFAWGGFYVGNPNRPDTVWQPAHCEGGCWKEGQYIKFIDKPKCNNLVWVDGQYDRNGNWVGGHYKVVRYVVVNPGSEARYSWFPT